MCDLLKQEADLRTLGIVMNTMKPETDAATDETAGPDIRSILLPGLGYLYPEGHLALRYGRHPETLRP